MEALAAKERERQEAERANDRRIVATHEASQETATARVVGEFCCAARNRVRRGDEPLTGDGLHSTVGGLLWQCLELKPMAHFPSHFTGLRIGTKWGFHPVYFWI